MPTILGELRRYFRDSTWDVRPARDLQELCLALEEAREELWGELGRQPTVADLGGRLGRAQEEIVEALQATEGRSIRSLDAPVHDEDNDSASAGDLIGAPDEEFDRVEANVTLERLTGILDERARQILHLRFADDLLQSEIAEMVGCSQMHVSRIIRSSLEKLYAYGSGIRWTNERRWKFRSRPSRRRRRSARADRHRPCPTSRPSRPTRRRIARPRRRTIRAARSPTARTSRRRRRPALELGGESSPRRTRCSRPSTRSTPPARSAGGASAARRPRPRAPAGSRSGPARGRLEGVEDARVDVGRAADRGRVAQVVGRLLDGAGDRPLA